MIDMRRIWNALRNIVTRARVDRSGDKPQIAWLGERITPDVEHLQGPGIYFIAPIGAFGAQLAPAGDPSVAMVVGLDGTRPAAPAEGEGGLHYLGEWRVFIASDGTVHLAQKDPADWVAVAGAVASELLRIQTDLTTLKSAISGATTVPNDGGSAFKAAIVAALSSFPSTPGSVASDKVRIPPAPPGS